MDAERPDAACCGLLAPHSIFIRLLRALSRTLKSGLTHAGRRATLLFQDVPLQRGLLNSLTRPTIGARTDGLRPKSLARDLSFSRNIPQSLLHRSVFVLVHERPRTGRIKLAASLCQTADTLLCGSAHVFRSLSEHILTLPDDARDLLTETKGRGATVVERRYASLCQVRRLRKEWLVGTNAPLSQTKGQLLLWCEAGNLLTGKLYAFCCETSSKLDNTGDVGSRSRNTNLPAADQTGDCLIPGSVYRTTSLKVLLYACIITHQTRPPRSN